MRQWPYPPCLPPRPSDASRRDAVHQRDDGTRRVSQDRFPQDTLQVDYRRDKNRNDWSPIEQGSPGQQTAAILAFILSHGDEPIILDQPEDDLDNHLIYDLIVQQIRESKRTRQIVIATHNPNIVVNGDAEMVLAMDVIATQCAASPNSSGCLQEPPVREEVCKVMEGGRDAFQQRYRRIFSSAVT